jgi:hypothetical protein
VVVGVVAGELELPDVAGGVEVEVLRGGALLVGEVDVPEPPGTEGTVGIVTVGVGTVTLGTVRLGTFGRFGVVSVGVDTFGVVTVSAEAGGRAAMPITTSVVTAPTTSFRFLDTVVNPLPQACSSKPPAPRPQASHVESLARLRSCGSSRSRAPTPQASLPATRHLEARSTPA